jgi:hypothetical protein
MEQTKNNRKDILYGIALAIILITSLIPQTAIYTRNENALLGIITNSIQAFGYLLCLVKIVLSRKEYSINEIVFFCVLFAVFFISGFNIQHKFFFLTAILLISTVRADSVSISKISLCIQSVILFVVVFLSQIGLLEDKIFNPETRSRHILGFNWITVAPILFFFICLLYIYIRSEKFKWYEAIVLELINYYFYHMTNTRMTFLLCSVVIIFFTVQSLWKGFFGYLKKLNWVYFIIPIVLVIVSIVAAYFYNPDNSIFLKANSILSGRLQLGHDALHYYKFPLFGQVIIWNGFGLLNDGIVDNYNYVDCSYLQIGMWYGAFVLILLIAIYMYGIYKSIKANNYWAVFVFLFVLVHSMTEPHLINVAVNAIVLLPLSDIRTIEDN